MCLLIHMNDIHASIYFSVKYAAYLGSSGLDTEVLVTREQVQHAVYEESPDPAEPFLPEWSAYRVFSIVQGGCCCMEDIHERLADK